MKQYSPAIVDGKIVRLSVSQLSRFDVRERGGCPRKYWFKYIGKIPDPPKVSQQEGIDGHKRFEDYYNGQPVTFLDCDIPALKELPPVGEAKPEVELTQLSCLRIPFQGAMDLLHGDDVYDYKYQAKIRVYEEPTAQLWGYLEEVRLRNNPSGRLGFHHVYIEKPPKPDKNGKVPSWEPKAKKVSQYFEPREVERNWLTYGSLIKEMHEVAAEKEADKVPINKAACYAYGPCPYLGICNRNPHQEEDIMGFLEDIEKAKKELAAQTPAVTLPEVDASLKVEMNNQVLAKLPVDPAAEARIEKLLAESRALPPDAPPADTVPAPDPIVKKRGRPPGKKVLMNDTDIPDSSPTYAPKTQVMPRSELKALRLGLTIGLPDYSSAHVFVEMAGNDEEKLATEIEQMIMRRLERVVAVFQKAQELKKAKTG